MREITYDTKTQQDWTIVILGGGLDRTNAEETDARLRAALMEGKALALELSGLEYLSSAGLRVFLRLGKQAKADGKPYALCGANGFVKEVIEDANLDVLVDVYRSTDDLP